MDRAQRKAQLQAMRKAELQAHYADLLGESGSTVGSGKSKAQLIETILRMTIDARETARAVRGY